MPRAAPRYSPLILEWVRALDDPAQPIAETCRRVGDAAEALALPRPSYSHLRRLVRRERRLGEIEQRRRADVRGAVGDAVFGLMDGRFVDPGYVTEQIRSANERAARASRDDEER